MMSTTAIAAKDEPSANTKITRTRRVHFQEDKNELYPNDTYTKEECETHWYNLDDYVEFRKDLWGQIQALYFEQHQKTTANGGEPSLPVALLQVYKVLCSTRDASRLPALFSTAPSLALSVQTLGVERRAVPAISRDAHARRRRILELAWQWQDLYAHRDLDLCNEMIRQHSRVWSLPSRLLAQHLAIVLAASDL